MHTSARQSLLSVMLSAVIISINHLYSLGPRAIGLGAVLLLVPAALLWWFRQTQSRVAFAGYLLMNAWIVIGFGLWEGLGKITLPLFLGTLLASLSTTFPSPTLGAYGFEATGILMFVGSPFVAYSAYRLVQARRVSTGAIQSERSLKSRERSLAASAGLTVASSSARTCGPTGTAGRHPPAASSGSASSCR